MHPKPTQLATAAYLLACASAFSMVWMSATFPLHPHRTPRTSIIVIWWGFYLCAPAGIILGVTARLWAGRIIGAYRDRAYAAASVTVGIIAIAAIAYNRYDQRAVRAVLMQRLPGTCSSSLRQVELGFQMYAQDYDDHLPLAGSWNGGIFPYLRNWEVYRCPLEADDTVPSYGMNASIAMRSLNLMQTPDRIVLLTDSLPGNNQLVNRSSLLRMKRHGESVNVGFADGHVKYHTIKAAEEMIWQPVYRTKPH